MAAGSPHLALASVPEALDAKAKPVLTMEHHTQRLPTNGELEGWVFLDLLDQFFIREDKQALMIRATKAMRKGLAGATNPRAYSKSVTGILAGAVSMG